MPFEKSSNWMAFEEASKQLNRFLFYFHIHMKEISTLAFLSSCYKIYVLKSRISISEKLNDTEWVKGSFNYDVTHLWRGVGVVWGRM